jgi:hypothetical protein
MSYITESKLTEIMDIPVSLPATQLKMGDWLVVAAFKLVAPAQLTCRYLNLQLLSSSVTPGNIVADNCIY